MLFLKVVMVVSKSQYVWVKNADARARAQESAALLQDHLHDTRDVASGRYDLTLFK